jgi:hypothetical protein
MGIERNDRAPKRRRTTAQRMKGRAKHAFELPAESPKPIVAKASNKDAAAASEKKAPAKKPAAKKPAAKKPVG